MSLRGCIGTFKAQELDDGLRSYDSTSAFEDTRFNPTSLRELPSLEHGVTLPTQSRTPRRPYGLGIGTHGLRTLFTYHNKWNGATCLPNIAREQGWTKEESVISMMRKAGWSEWSSEWRSVRDLNVVRY